MEKVAKEVTPPVEKVAKKVTPKAEKVAKIVTPSVKEKVAKEVTPPVEKVAKVVAPKAEKPAKEVTPVVVKMVKITQVKSAIGYSKVHKATIRALGIHRMHQTVEHPDTLTLRGMLRKVNNLVKIEE